MSLDLLVDIVHSANANSWKVRNEAAFEGLFGAPAGRYQAAAKDSVRLRAPDMSGDGGVSYAAYIHPENPTSGMYGGMSFVLFPIEGGPCLIGLVVGTGGLAPDHGILGRPGHARKAQAICAWLGKEYGSGIQVAWAKQDPTRTDLPIPSDLLKSFSRYKGVLVLLCY